MASASFKRLPPKVRLMFRVTEGFQKLRIMPTPDKAAKVPAAKRQLSKPASWMIKNHCTTVEVHEEVIDGRGGPIRIRIYKPKNWVDGGPGLLYIHGGGFVMGGLDGCDNICRHFSDRSGAVIASVEYRLAPEDPFPAGLEDCEDAWRWFVETRPHGIDPAKAGVAGDSAGGNLASSLAVKMRDEKGPSIKWQGLIYPLVDWTFSQPSWTECAGAGVDIKAAQGMARAYCGDSVGNPLLGALAVKDLSNLPPALVVTSDFDTLRDEAISYAERLLEAGVKTQHIHYMGTAHGFLSLPALYPGAEAAFDEISLAIRNGLAA